MKTYPEMNAVVKELLRLDGSDYAVYAAQRIEELETEVQRLRTVVQAAQLYLDAKERLDVHLERHDCQDFVCGWRNGLEKRWVEAEKALKQSLAALDGKEPNR